MKITVLIGNGFDVSLGIKSSYGEFYKWYCAQKSDVEHIQKFRNDIKEDISRDVPDEEKTWADFELGLGKYTDQFTLDNASDFVDCLEDAQGSIREYLLTEQNKFSADQFTEESISSLRMRLQDFTIDLPEIERDAVIASIKKFPNEHREIQFITFNYTNSLERIMKAIPDELFATWTHGPSTYGYKINKKVHHVHGTIDEFPVLGVNDVSQIANQQLLDVPQFKEYMVKADNITALGLRWHSVAETQISQSRIVCLYGMSLGASDAKWWRKLAQWLLADSGRHLMLYWYMRKAPNRISSIRQLQTVDLVKEKFLAYSENLSDADKQKIKSRIHVVINTKNFLSLDRKPIKGKVVPSAVVPYSPEQLDAIANGARILSDPAMQRFDKLDESVRLLNDYGTKKILDAYNRDLQLQTK